MIWDEWIEVNSVQIPNDVDSLFHAWRYVDPGLSEMHLATPVRGENTIIPGSPGRYPNPRTADELVIQVPLRIRGWYDVDGDPHTDPRQGLIDNFAYLKSNLGIATANAQGEAVGLLWHQPEGDEFVASAFVELVGFTKVSHVEANTVLRLTIASGELVLWPGS